MKKKITAEFFFIILIALFSKTAFAQNFGAEVLKHSSFTVSCPYSLTTGELFNYSKTNTGVEIRIGTELLNFNINKTPLTLGLCTTYNYNRYFFVREEIRSFYSNCFLEGIWFQFPLPKNFLLQADLNFGLAVTKAKALSIEGKSLENFYNSFIAGTTVVAIKELYAAGKIKINADAGIELRGYFEQDSWFQTVGIIAGIMIKAR